VGVDGPADRPIAATGYLVINPVATGEHTVTLVTNYPPVGFAGCFVTVNQVQTTAVTVTVPAGGMGRINYDVVCIP
jgi:hypothetical protein